MKETNKKKYKITVITICRNAEDVIEKTIKSVLSQDYVNIEYIIVDGASTDNTIKIVEKYARDYSIRYISEKDDGIYNAMNKGVRMSTGDYIIFENAGDIFKDKKVISDVVQCMQIVSADIYYGNCIKMINGEKVILKIDKGKLKALLKGSMPCHQSIFASKRLLEKYPFDESYIIRSDFDWLLKCKKSLARFCYINRIICVFDGNGLSMRRSKKRKLDIETQRSVQTHFPFLYWLRNML